MSVGGGAYQPWLTNTAATSAAYTTGAGLVYAWRARDRDLLTKFSRATKPVRVLVSGTVANGARGGVYITVRVWSGRTRKTVTAITTARSGRWKAALRIPARHARFTRAEAKARYDADFTYVGSLSRRSLRVR